MKVSIFHFAYEADETKDYVDKLNFLTLHFQNPSHYFVSVL